MYEDIFAQIRNEAEKRNLKETTINAYCKSVGYFLRIVNKDVSALTTDDVDAFLLTALCLLFCQGMKYRALLIIRLTLNTKRSSPPCILPA